MPIPAPTTYATLSAMITPALFMTANGSLIISTSNRMSRIVDRIRVLTDLEDRIGRGATDLDFLDDRQRHLADQLDALLRRSAWVRAALSLLYGSFSTFVGTSLTLALDVLLNNWIVMVPTLLSVAGVSLMLLACMCLIAEAWLALRGNGEDIRFSRALQVRRRDGSPPAPGGESGGE